jgi:hypothetical protein
MFWNEVDPSSDAKAIYLALKKCVHLLSIYSSLHVSIPSCLRSPLSINIEEIVSAVTLTKLDLDPGRLIYSWSSSYLSVED